MGAHWPARAQDEIFTAAKGDFIAPHRAPPGGTLVPAEGGYAVSGRWRYSSGVPYATHFIGGVMRQPEDPGAAPKVVNVVVSRGWTQSQQAGRLAFEAVELLWRTSDSSVTGRRGQRMQRYYKDVSMYRGHGAAQPDIIAPWAVQVTLGLPFENPMAPRPRPAGTN